MNTNMSLAIYESQELTETEKDYLLAVLEAGEEDYQRGVNKAVTANRILSPVKVASDLAAVGGGGSWLVFHNQLRKAEAELQKKTYLYNTASDKREKGELEIEIRQLKEKIAGLEKKMKVAKKVGLTGLATGAGTVVVAAGVGASAGKDIRRGLEKQAAAL